MLELATLGALMAGPQHGYALKAWLERYMGSQITVNFGAIYPLLRRLSEQGLITSRDEVAGDKRKATTYSITREGRRRFKEEMLKFPNESKVNARTRFLTKVYFFGHVSGKVRAEILGRRLGSLVESTERAVDMEWPAEQFKRAVYQFAIGQIEAEAIWVAELLSQERATS